MVKEKLVTIVARLDERVKNHTEAIKGHSDVISTLNGKIDVIMTNDLPHIRKELALSKQKLAILVGAISAIISALVVKGVELLFGI